jgi:uncharacterized protein (DUF885 family)
MIDRRAFLLSSAALAGCASPRTQATAAHGEAFRTLLDRIAADPPAARLTALNTVDPKTLPPDARVIYGSLGAGTYAEAGLAAFAYGQDGRPYVVTHRAGAWRRIASELGGDGMPLAVDLDAETARIEADAARGVTPPDFILDRTLLALDGAREPLMRARGVGAVAIGAALARQTEALMGLRATASPAPGVSRLPNGRDYYGLTIGRTLGGLFSPRYAHEIAQEQCDALSNEAIEIFSTIDLTSGDVGARFRALAQNQAYLYSDNDSGKARAVADMNANLVRARTLMTPAFSGDLAQTPSSVLRMGAEDEARGAAGRREGGDYIVDLIHIRTRPSWTLPSVVHHETLPGHALQARLQAEAAPPRLQVSTAGAFSEGWAIYAEALADELGAFADAPLARLGYLHWMLFRYGRALVDTGMHAMGWSRARAVETLRSLQGFDAAFVSIDDDIDRMCVEPGVYTAQALAAWNIREERDDAEKRYHGRYTLAAFHDAVLRSGPLARDGLGLAVHLAFGERNPY